MLNPDGRLWLDRLSGGLEDTGFRLSAADGERIVRLVAHHVGAEVHAGSPRVSAELPDSGERFEGLLPPVVVAPSCDQAAIAPPRTGFGAHADGLARADNPGGCLANNACAELGGRDGQLGATVAEGVRSTELAVFSALSRWQTAGRLRSGDLRPLARFIVVLLRGMATVHKATGDASAPREAGEVGLAALEPWLTKRRSARSAARAHAVADASHEGDRP